MGSGVGSRGWAFLRVLGAFALAAAAGSAQAQDPQPRPYSNAPVGLNFLLVGYSLLAGDIVGEESVVFRDARIRAQIVAPGYVRVVDVLGCSAKLQAVVPYVAGSARAESFGRQRDRRVSGLGDPQLRMTVNFYGAPALAQGEFARYEQDLVVGASLQVGVPLGEYDPDRLVNIGAHRWSFRPQLGASKSSGPWFFDAAAGVQLFTENRDFFGGRTRKQDPLYEIDGFVVYTAKPDLFAVLFATYFTGGRTTVGGVRRDNRQANSRIGLSLSLPVTARQSIRLFASRSVRVRRGGDFTNLGIVWQLRWGAGL